MWDTTIADFLAGGSAIPPAFQRWHSSYNGTGRGEVELAAFPEPFLGSLVQPKAVFLALNPGRADLSFQGRDGIFATEIQAAGSYSAWAASWPYLRDPWVAKKGKNPHHSSRLQFMRNWFDDSQLPCSRMVGFELYPWHSTGVTGPIRPDRELVEEFVWRPVAELGAPVFAFGAPWFSILESVLGLRVVARLGLNGEKYESAVASRSVIVLTDDKGLSVIAEKHAGSACPPSRDETYRLKDGLDRLLR
jgi:hypothetical protein